MATSSSSLNWEYDVFLSFRGGDVRPTFLSHVFKEFNRKLINGFKDYEIVKGQSLWPELVKAIRSSRIPLVVFSKNYASSSWCLNELLEIVKCKDKIIPIFYGVDPSDVRKQTGDFGKIFQETCKTNNTKEVKKQLWKKALTNVANMAGFDFANCNHEAKMIEDIANDVLRKLLSNSSKDFENFVGIEDHLAKMSELLQLESDEVRMVGIWGSSGIGKTIIARALFNQLPQHFQGSIFIDRGFVSKSKEIYRSANPDDHNMKLHLQGQFLSEILGMKDIKIDNLSALEQKLKRQKVLIIIDDLDGQVALDSLVGQTQWFGSGSRIIVVTNDKHLLKAHDSISHIYEVSLPAKERALEMLCQSAFKQNSPRKGFEKLAVEVVRHVGSLPLALNVLGLSLRGRDKKYWMELLPRLQNCLHNKIKEVLKASYDGLVWEQDKEIFRYIACFFNHAAVTYMEMLLADSNLGVSTALENLADKALIHVRRGHVEMHCLLQAMGLEIVRTQSIKKPGKREFLVDPKDISNVLNKGTGTQKVIGILLDTSEIDDLHVHESAFKEMDNLRFLEIYSSEEQVILHLPESFDYLPSCLKLLWWSDYPMSCMPSNFLPKNLVKLDMQNSKLEKLWEGIAPLTFLKELDLSRSYDLKEIPDLSKATNLETLILCDCSSLVELPSSIRNLNKLLKLNMSCCKNLESLPAGFHLKSLDYLNFGKCWKLRTFPDFTTNISVLNLVETNIEEFPSNLRLENLVNLTMSKVEIDGKEGEGVKPLTPFMEMLSPTLTYLYLVNIPNLVELPSSFKNLNQLRDLWIINCRNLKTLPTGINLESLYTICFRGCSQLRSFPKISTNISCLYLSRTGIEEVPWWIEKFSNLAKLTMHGCRKLKCVSLNISKLKYLSEVDFSDCGELTRVDLSGNSSEVAMQADNIDTVPEEASSSLSDDYAPKAKLNFSDCFNLDQDALLQQQSISFDYMVLPGEEVPSYFTHRTTGMSPLLHVPLSQPFFIIRVCAVVNAPDGVYIDVNCQFKGKYGSSFDSIVKVPNLVVTRKGSHQQLIFDCRINLNKDIAYLPQLKYDQMDMKIHASAGPPGWNFMFSIRGWGIRLLEDCSSPENLLGPYSFLLRELTDFFMPWQMSSEEIANQNTLPRGAYPFLLRQLTDDFMLSKMEKMSSEEIALYFPHRTNGNSLTNIPLPHTSLSQPFFRFSAYVEVDCESSGQFSRFRIQFSFRFRDRFGNHFDSPYRPHIFCNSSNGPSCDLLECLFPRNGGNASLAQLNYDHVDIHFQLTNRSDSTTRLREWGIHIFEDCSSPENQIGNPNTLQHVCEANVDNTVSDGCHETKSSEECEDSDDGDKGYYETDQSEKCGDSDYSDIGSETDQSEECEDSDDNDKGSETDQSEECGDSD